MLSERPAPTLRTAASKSAWLLRKKGPFEK